ncbi:hypothetical protein M434DRAFT_28226 [Hypoxylon sp. CO27-5]|nr:hypothetical protein M434DRAFT_28226 [Hypoxylon sp. CO27-5]
MASRINDNGVLKEGMGVQHEPVAVVGNFDFDTDRKPSGCRLPGQITSPSDLWSLLIQNKSAHCKVPESRFNADGFYHPDIERPGSINSTGGYFIQDLRSFENTFFGINNLEALYMDAQQRKLLEVVYESFENGGVPLSQVQGSTTGVYIGNFTNDYMIMQFKDPEYFSRYSGTGSDPTILANRITHCFDLRGPSVVLDTACSSSIYALHFACLALDTHDCDAAVVASANLIQSVEQHLINAKAGILSPDSTCHTFDESANGYARAEGVSSLYLKRLSDAQRDGDPIRCVIRGTAINGNGRTPGIVQPSIDGQEAVIRAAYRRACLPTDETDYVEAHGTGTKVGDPIELEAISRVFHHKTGNPTAVGGIKPNLGHSEGASGLSSIIKLVLALERGEIPATIGIKKINPSIKLDNWNLDIVKENRLWPKSRVLRASVNSFGFGGANGHAILESQPVRPKNVSNNHIQTEPCSYGSMNGNASADGISQLNPVLITFSARTEHSIDGLVKNIANYVSRPDTHVDLGDLTYTLNCRRSRLATRGYTIVTPQTLAEDIDPTKLIKNSSEIEALPLAFVFTGQGAQWPGMGSHLFHQYSKFRESIRYLDSCLSGLSAEDKLSWTLEDILLAPAESSDINLAEKSQPICTAIQVALVDLLREWNITPQVAIGHSSGEIGAAYAAGHLSAYQAIMAAYFRGRTVAQNARDGAMIAVGLSKESAQALIDEHDLAEHITLACDNSPENTTLSGDADAIDKLLSILHSRQTFARKLKTNGKAYHSKHMKEISHIYQQSLDRVWRADERLGSKNALNGGVTQRITNTQVRIISSVTGAELTSNDMTTTEYWVANLESPVKFCDAVKGVFGLGQYQFLELGPHSALELPIKQTAISENRAPGYYAYNSALVRGKDAIVTLLSLVGSLFLQGNDDLLFENILPDNLASESVKRRVLTDLPHYFWDYTAPVQWSEPRAAAEFRNRHFPRHELLGSRIPGASKLTTIWRNIIDLNEAPWLKDHCLGPSIVFPAAAYLAMGVEAVCQVNGIHLRDCPGVEMHNCNFLKAMDFHAEQRPRIEVISEMQRAHITSTLSSDTWWQFTVTSISGKDSLPIIHATGLVSLAKAAHILPRTINLDKDMMEQQAARMWYDKFAKEGMNWGPNFAVMEDIYCDGARQANESLALTHLLRGDQTGASQSWQYIAHPISVDSMLQTAFVATTGGWIRKLRALVPVKIDKISFSAPSLVDMDLKKTWAIDGKARLVGFGTVSLEAELYNNSGDTLVHLEGARCIAYQGNTQQEAPEERHPMCRVVWRPDLMLMDAGANTGLTKYIDWFVQRFADEQRVSGLLLQLAGALDLYAHKNPKAQILVLDANTDMLNFLLTVLNAESPMRRFESFTQARFVNGELHGREVSSIKSDTEEKDEAISKETKFDLIFSCGTLPIAVLEDWMAVSTTFITGKRVEEDEFIESSVKAITGTAMESASITVISKIKPTQEQKKYDVVMVNRTGQHSALDSEIHEAVESYFGCAVSLIGISEVNERTIPSRSVVISTIESKEPILSSISEEQMRFVKTITDRASFLLWVCNGDFIAGTNPDFAPVLGLSRAVMLEQPSLRFSVFDIDDTTTDIDVTAQHTCKIIDQLIRDPNPEFELSQKGGVIHSVRFEPLDELNAQFRSKQDEELLEVPIEKAGRCQLHISHPGQMDTIHFTSEEYTKPLPADHVEIEVKSVGMNAKDLYVLSAKIDTQNVSCSCECAGLVVNVGSDVFGLKPGDRVVALAPGHFSTHERLPQWALCKLEDNEDFTTASTIPVVFSTAIYSLIYRANLQPGECVLIHSAAGGVGLAAIQLAQHIGAEIFATVGSESKKEFLVKEFGLDEGRIFSSRNDSFLPAIMKATDGRGVDVVLNSLTGELLRSSFEACANFGRFVEIGKRDILDHGLLNMAAFGKSVSFLAFDLSDLFYSQKKAHHDLWQKLLVESMNLIRDGIAKPCSPIETFRASEITQAFRYFSLGTRMGKVTVSFQDGADLIHVKPRRYEATFSPTKSYLMIGCLGGLGRSISKLMISRGAKSFVFLGRSGLKKPEAKMLVDDLVKQGAHVEVVQGDVSKYDDVEKTIEQAPFPVGGVIHAAMGLDEALWSSMSHASWHTSIAPKVRGSWNLHNALGKDGRDSLLDFFILTSSVAGTTGTATESNYCAANSFLDAFARYRNRLGRPAISIGYGMIAEVGYLHEHPDIEALLKRKGICSLTEDELLQILDLAIVRQSPCTWAPHYDSLAGAHILTGIEFTGLKEQRGRGFEGDTHVLADPRASLLAAAFARSTRGSNGAAVPAGHSLLSGVTNMRASGASVFDAVQEIVANKISNLILLPVEQLRPEQKLGEFGIDSMLAAEFRTSIFHALEVDVPFMTLLDKQTSVRSLTEIIMEGLKSRQSSNTT